MNSDTSDQIKLIVVDDEPTQRLLLTRTLEKDWNHSILVAENGHQAIELAEREEGPLLLLLDWMMPDLSG
ncbi:MAG: response regulator, partial [Bdellovibrionales bacterium]|nr:response regulator [Bdellovibrionales bacterium]